MTACLSVRQFPDKSDAFPAAAVKEREQRTDATCGDGFFARANFPEATLPNAVGVIARADLCKRGRPYMPNELIRLEKRDVEVTHFL